MDRNGMVYRPQDIGDAGHCVCIKGSGIPGRDGWVRSIQVIPGRNGSAAPYGSVTSSVFWSVKGWVETGDENYDYAAIILPVELGKRTGWFGFGVLSDDTLKECTEISPDILATNRTVHCGGMRINWRRSTERRFSTISIVSAVRAAQRFM